MQLPYHVLFIKGTPVLVTFPIFLYLSIKIITADPLKKTPQEIESALKKFKIIPDVLDVAPKKAIKVSLWNLLTSKRLCSFTEKFS